MSMLKRGLALGLMATLVGMAGVSCENKAAKEFAKSQNSGNLGASASVKQLMAARHLTESDVEAALKTFVPPGKRDEYMIFASGGQSGQILVMGVPSMRLLKVIGVFTPEPWQGYGYGGESNKILAAGAQGKQALSWADVHHPNLSETNGDYDGQFLFVNDKANGRVAVVDLEDFATKQIVANPLVGSDHGGAFVDPNTNYVIETSQYPTPLGRDYAPLSAYKEKYRGVAVFWKFDRKKKRIDPSQSFGVELPPYTQDLADAGKLGSDGWAFINSFNTEMAIGGTLQGKPPIESGASQNDMDYMHIIDWKKAEALVKAGKAVTIKGMKVLPLAVSGAEARGQRQQRHERQVLKKQHAESQATMRAVELSRLGERLQQDRRGAHGDSAADDERREPVQAEEPGNEPEYGRGSGHLGSSQTEHLAPHGNHAREGEFQAQGEEQEGNAQLAEQ